MVWSRLLCRVLRDDTRRPVRSGIRSSTRARGGCVRTRPVLRPDLKVFFTFVKKSPQDVTSSDVLDFVADQKAPKACRKNGVRLLTPVRSSPPRPWVDACRPLRLYSYLLATAVTSGRRLLTTPA